MVGRISNVIPQEKGNTCPGDYSSSISVFVILSHLIQHHAKLELYLLKYFLQTRLGWDGNGMPWGSGTFCALLGPIEVSIDTTC